MIEPSAMLDASFDIDDPTASLKAFVNVGTCKLVFSFS